MAFRANEAREELFTRTVERLTEGLKTKEQKEEAIAFLEEARLQLGNCLETYPTWHPLADPENLYMTRLGSSLDHIFLFSGGLITCPYGDGSKVLEDIENFNRFGKSDTYVIADVLDVKLYNEATTSIMITCDWKKDLLSDGTIPLSVALPLLLQTEIKNWTRAEVAETWETMQHRFLGHPHGKRSSLCVNQEAGVYMKKTWEMVIKSGMFGPIYY